RGHADAVGRIDRELVAQRADRDAQNICGMGTVAEAVLERLQDEVAFDLGDGSTNDGASRGLVATDKLVGVVGDGRQYGADHLGIRRQRDVFPGARADGRNAGLRIVIGATGYDWHRNALGFEPQYEVANVDRNVDHQEVGAFAGT